MDTTLNPKPHTALEAWTMLHVRGDGGYAEKANLCSRGLTFPTLESPVIVLLYIS
jgi:hypothetical protein